MTITELRNQIETYLIVDNIEVEEEYIPHIAALTYESNYIQILYDYGIDVLLLLLKLLEKNEIYEQCAVIKQTIENTNKLENKNLPTIYRKNE